MDDHIQSTPDIKTAEYCTEYTLKNAKIRNIDEISHGRHILGYECMPGYTYNDGPNEGRLICSEVKGKVEFVDRLPECTFSEEIAIGLGVALPLSIIAITLLVLYIRIRRKNQLNKAESRRSNVQNINKLSWEPVETTMRYTRESQLPSNKMLDMYPKSTAKSYADSDEDDYSTATPDDIYPDDIPPSSSAPSRGVSTTLPRNSKSISGLSQYEPKMKASVADPLHKHDMYEMGNDSYRWTSGVPEISNYQTHRAPVYDRPPEGSQNRSTNSTPLSNGQGQRKVISPYYSQPPREV